MAGFHFKLLLLLLAGISSSSGYHHVELTARPQYVSHGDEVKFECVFRTNEARPTYTRLVLSIKGHPVKEVQNAQIKWESSGNIHHTNLAYSASIYQDDTYSCIAHFGKPIRKSVNDNYTVMVCCPLRIESKKLVIDMSRDIYGLDIMVSGNDVGKGTVTPTNTNSPVSVSVTSSVMPGRFQLGQIQANLFSVRWKMRPDWTGSCADQRRASNDYTFSVHGKKKLETVKDVPFKTFYPALWNRIAKRVYTIADGDRYNRTIRCDICANPPPTISWYLCGEKPPIDVIISQSGAELTIPEVQEHHVGVYVCIATNNIDNQQWTKKFEIKLSLNSSQTEPSCLRDARVNTFVIPTVIVIVLAVIVCVICWKCRQIQDFCQGLKEHVTSDLPEDRWTDTNPPPTIQVKDKDPPRPTHDSQPPDVLPDQTPTDKPPQEAAAGVQYAVLDELKPCPKRTATLPRGNDDDRVEYATVTSGTN